MDKTIVWIEDNDHIVRSLVEPLEDSGYTITCLRSVEEALNNLELIRKSDLILLDIILPSGNPEKPYSRYAGIQLLRELRETHHIENPVVVLSIVISPEIHQEALDLGVKDFVTRPVWPSELKERVMKVVEAQR